MGVTFKGRRVCKLIFVRMREGPAGVYERLSVTAVARIFEVVTMYVRSIWLGMAMVVYHLLDPKTIVSPVPLIVVSLWIPYIVFVGTVHRPCWDGNCGSSRPTCS